MFKNFFKRSHNCFTCEFKGTFSLLNIASFFFSKIIVDEKQLEHLSSLKEKGHVVLLGKYKSHLDFFFYNMWLKKKGFSYPKVALDYSFFLFLPLSFIFKILINHLRIFFKTFKFADPYKSSFIKNCLLENKNFLFFSLIEKKGFYRFFVKKNTDPISHFIQMQEEIDKPIFFLPQILYFNTRPMKKKKSLLSFLLGNEEKPSKIARIFTILKSPKKVFCEFYEPINLQDFLKAEEIKNLDNQEKAKKLRSFFLLKFSRFRQGVSGPVLKSREEIIEGILLSEKNQKFMKDFARKNNTNTSKIYKLAHSHLHEIVSDYTTSWILFYEIFLNFVFNNIFNGIIFDTEEIKKLKQASYKAPLIFVPCHKSHLDYLILSYLLYKNRLACPLIAAGKNLSFWPLGTLFRKGGAFFLRRTFKGDELYSKIFSAYLEKILTEGYNVEFFIEGGRSRTGKLLMPKLGILSFLIKAWINKACEDFTIVPVYIGYDRVLEEAAYLKEIEGGDKQDENLKQVVKSRKFLKKNYGKAYVKFGEMISISDYFMEKDKDPNNLKKEERKKIIESLGYKIISSINNETIITPYSLCGSVILNFRNSNFNRTKFKRRSKLYYDFLKKNEHRFSDSLKQNCEAALDTSLNNYVQAKLIEKHDQEANLEPSFSISPNKRSLIEFYKNNIISYFLDASFTAIAILKIKGFEFYARDLSDDFLFLKSFFKKEFVYEDAADEKLIRKNIKIFLDLNIINSHPTKPNCYMLFKDSLSELISFASFSHSYLESYKVALDYLKISSKQASSDKAYINKIKYYGNVLNKRGLIEKEESISIVNYKNAVLKFISKEINSKKDIEKINVLSEKLKYFLEIFSSFL